MRPRPKRNAQIEARLDEVAQMRAHIPTYRELEIETGLSQSYLRQTISEKIREIVDATNQSSVSRGA